MIVYRDTATDARILIPVDKARHKGSKGLIDKNSWYVECAEVTDFLGKGYMKVRKIFVSSIILERYYKKEEL